MSPSSTGLVQSMMKVWAAAFGFFFVTGILTLSWQLLRPHSVLAGAHSELYGSLYGDSPSYK